MSGISSKALNFGDPENNKKYNGIEFDNDLDLDIYEAYYRNLDPQIGRWWQIDPKCEANINPDFDDDDETIVEGLESMSPYTSMGNNPVKHSDPNGDIFGIDNLVGAVVGAVIDYGSQVVENLSSGKSLNQSLTQVDGKRIATAAVVGFITDGVANIAGKALTKAGSAVVTKLEPTVAKLAQSNVVNKVSKVGKDIIQKTGVKLSKVEKIVQESKVGDFTKKTKISPGIGPGQSRAEISVIKNSEGKTVKTFKDSYDRANNFQGRKPLRGGPEGRPQI